MARGLAIGLAGLAGFVDAMGFLMLSGFYVAFMSGNSTLLSIGIAAGSEGRMELAAGLVASFVAGVALGTLVGQRMGRHRPAGTLVTVAALLAVACGLNLAGAFVSCGLMLALAMGAENTVFQKQGQTGIGLTYMTGTLVRLGQRLAEAVTGGSWAAILPDVLLWVGMLAGALLGAAMFRLVGLAGMWLAVGAALAMALAAWLDAREAE